MENNYTISGSLNEIRRFAQDLDGLPSHDVYILESILEVEPDLQQALQLLIDDNYTLYEGVYNCKDLGEYLYSTDLIQIEIADDNWIDFDAIGEDYRHDGHFTDAGFLIIHY